MDCELIFRVTTRNFYTYAMLAIVVLAATLRFWQLGGLSIWQDEGHTALDSTLTFSELWSGAYTDKPPLYYYITHFFWSYGDSEFFLRLPAAIIGVLTIIFAWYLGARIFGPKGALLLSFLLSISTTNIMFSQEARQYILVCLGWLFTIYAFYGLVGVKKYSNSSSNYLMMLGLGSLIMIHTHLIGIVYLTSGIISYCLASISNKKKFKNSSISPILIVSISLLTLLPWLINFHSNYSSKEIFSWLSQVDIKTAIQIFVDFAFGGVFLCAFSITGFLLYRNTIDEAKGNLFLGLLFFPPILMWLFGFIKPMYMPRTIMPSHINALLGLVFFLIIGLRKQWQLFLVFLLISSLISYSTFQYFTNYSKEDWRGLANQIRANEKTYKMIFFQKVTNYKPAFFYLNKEMPPSYFFTKNTYGSDVVVDCRLAWKTKCYRHSCDSFVSKISPKISDDIGFVIRKGEPDFDSRLLNFESQLNQLSGQKYKMINVWKSRGVVLVHYSNNELSSFQ